VKENLVHLLSNEERLSFKEVFENEFDSELPNARQANIVAYGNSAFITTEVLLRAGLVWVDPSLRNTPKSASILKRLVQYLHQHIPKGSSVIGIATNPKEERLMQRMGMRRVEGIIYRKDV